MNALLGIIIYIGIMAFADKVRKINGWPWVIGAGITNQLAHSFGNFSDVGYFIWQLVIGGGTLVLIMAFTKRPEELGPPSKLCSYCAETILLDAKLCKHCGKDCT